MEQDATRLEPRLATHDLPIFLDYVFTHHLHGAVTAAAAGGGSASRGGQPGATTPVAKVPVEMLQEWCHATNQTGHKNINWLEFLHLVLFLKGESLSPTSPSRSARGGGVGDDPPTRITPRGIGGRVTRASAAAATVKLEIVELDDSAAHDCGDALGALDGGASSGNLPPPPTSSSSSGSGLRWASLHGMLCAPAEAAAEGDEIPHVVRAPSPPPTKLEEMKLEDALAALRAQEAKQEVLEAKLEAKERQIAKLLKMNDF